MKRIQGRGNLLVTEYIISYKEQSSFVISIMEFQDCKVVHERNISRKLLTHRLDGAI